MRFIVYGVGAIGGTTAAALALSGQEVVGIARGGMLDAIRQRGLLLRTPSGATTARFPCHADPAEIAFTADDVILLTMKTQDTEAALLRLREAGISDQPIVCMQNGVANERMALRLFPNVYAVTVMMPSDYSRPGEVNAFSAPRHGIFDIGRYPGGSDVVTANVAGALERANIGAFVQSDVMASKYGKLLINLRNVIEAALGVDADSGPFNLAVRAEGEAVYEAAGIVWRDVGAVDPRREQLMQQRAIDGVARAGGSSTQSLTRSTGTIETDYLNGEIVLLGRLHGVATPANAWFCALARRMVREKLKPGAIATEEIAAGLSQAVNGNWRGG
jgi:2-dehydropantoate 2-reductase